LSVGATGRGNTWTVTESLTGLNKGAVKYSTEEMMKDLSFLSIRKSYFT
jgi:hypothetical protein